MNWYYESAGQQQGPVTEQDLDRLLAEGKITQETLVWREGMASWTPLRQVRGAASAPGQARCASCGGSFPAGDMLQLQDRLICPNCKPAVVQKLQQGGELPDLGAFNRTGPAWEQRQQLGLVKAAWETTKAVLMTPSETFSTMKREGGIGGPFLFALLLGSIGGVLAVIYNMFFQGAMLGAASAANSGQGGSAMNAQLIGLGGGGIIGIIIVPVQIAFTVFVGAGIVHLCLMMVGGAKQPFETTCRVVCYTTGAAGLLQVVPFCGAIVGGIWALVSEIIGLARAHETTIGRAVIAVFLPMIVCCGAAFLIVMAVMGTAGFAR